MEKHQYNNKRKLDNLEEPIIAFYSKNIANLGVSSIGSSKINLTRKGISKKEIENLMVFYALDLEQISDILKVSSRTLMRKDESMILNPHISQQVIFLILLAQNGLKVFQNKIDFNDWLRTPLMAFGNKKPIDYLDTAFGIQEIINQLGRIEYGVYA